MVSESIRNLDQVILVSAPLIAGMFSISFPTNCGEEIALEVEPQLM